MIDQQGDLLVIVTPDGIDISVKNGVAEMTRTVANLATLCLIGGNQFDNATPETDHLQWMGNEDEEPENQYRSRFLSLLYGNSVNSSSLKALQDAAIFDLTNGLGDMIESVTVSIDLVNSTRVMVTCDLVMANELEQKIALEFAA